MDQPLSVPDPPQTALRPQGTEAKRDRPSSTANTPSQKSPDPKMPRCDPGEFPEMTLPSPEMKVQNEEGSAGNPIEFGSDSSDDDNGGGTTFAEGDTVKVIHGDLHGDMGVIVSSASCGLKRKWRVKLSDGRCLSLSEGRLRKECDAPHSPKVMIYFGQRAGIEEVGDAGPLGRCSIIHEWGKADEYASCPNNGSDRGRLGKEGDHSAL